MDIGTAEAGLRLVEERGRERVKFEFEEFARLVVWFRGGGERRLVDAIGCEGLEETCLVHYVSYRHNSRKNKLTSLENYWSISLASEDYLIMHHPAPISA